MSVESIVKQINEDNRLKWQKYVYTVILFLTHFIFGISRLTFGPVFVDMKHILNTSIDKISLITICITIGFIIGSLIGYLFKYINRQITIIILIIMMGISSILVPYSEQLWHLYLCTVVFGIGAGAWYNVNVVWLIEMWQLNSAPILQLSQFMYGIGTIIGPFMDKPYLTGEDQDNFDLSLSVPDLLPLNDTIFTIKDIDRRCKLKTPFLIIGMMQMIGPILLTIMLLVKSYKISSLEIEENDEKVPNKLLESNESPRRLIITLTMFYTGFYVATETLYFDFSATFYQYIPLKLTASKSAEIVSASALSYTIGRGISALIAIKIKPQYMMSYHFLILLFGIIFTFFGQNSLAILWVGSLLTSFGFSAMIPSIFSFIGQYLDVTNEIGALLLFSANVLDLFLPFISGYFIEKYTNVYIFLIATNLSMSIIIFITILFFIAKTFREKTEKL